MCLLTCIYCFNRITIWLKYKTYTFSNWTWFCLQVLPPSGGVLELQTYPLSFFLLSNLKSGGYLWTLIRWSFLHSLVLNLCPQPSNKHWYWKGENTAVERLSFLNNLTVFQCMFLNWWMVTLFTLLIKRCSTWNKFPGVLPCLVFLRVQRRGCRATPEGGCPRDGRWGRSGDRSSRRVGAGSCSDARTPLK